LGRDEERYEIHAKRGLSSIDRYRGEVVPERDRGDDDTIWRVFWTRGVRGGGRGVGGWRGGQRSVRDARDEHAEKFVQFGDANAFNGRRAKWGERDSAAGDESESE
tara:strand:+ start:57 stop:374 length:318 start_codon:yes stop_codon:yes gene_type:complete